MGLTMQIGGQSRSESPWQKQGMRMGKTRLRVGRAGDEGEGKKRLGRWGKERSEAERRDRRGEAAMLAPRGDSEGRKKCHVHWLPVAGEKEGTCGSVGLCPPSSLPRSRRGLRQKTSGKEDRDTWQKSQDRRDFFKLEDNCFTMEMLSYRTNNKNLPCTGSPSVPQVLSPPYSPLWHSNF